MYIPMLTPWHKDKSKNKNKESAREAIRREHPDILPTTKLESDRLEKIDKILKYVMDYNLELHDYPLTFAIIVFPNQAGKPIFEIIIEEESGSRGTILYVKELDMLRSELSKIEMQFFSIRSVFSCHQGIAKPGGSTIITSLKDLKPSRNKKELQTGFLLVMGKSYDGEPVYNIDILLLLSTYI